MKFRICTFCYCFVPSDTMHKHMAYHIVVDNAIPRTLEDYFTANEYVMGVVNG